MNDFILAIIALAMIIHHLLAAGTVDEQVMRALKAKDTSQAALLAALKERRTSNG